VSIVNCKKNLQYTYREYIIARTFTSIDRILNILVQILSSYM